MIVAELKVRRADLLKLLRAMGRFTKASTKDEAILRLSEGMLEIDVNGMAASIPTDGSWNGEARVPAAFLVQIGKGLPKDDPFEIAVRNGRCHIGPLSVMCVWQAVPNERIELPMDAPLPRILALRQGYSAEAIERSGLMKTLAEAEKKRDDIIRSAAKLLAPLAVEESDIERIVAEAVRRSSE